MPSLTSKSLVRMVYAMCLSLKVEGPKIERIRIQEWPSACYNEESLLVEHQGQIMASLKPQKS